MTHTPGPWYAVDNGHYIDIKISDDIYAPSVADVSASKFLEGGDNSKANASLIAAAPDLLEALKAARIDILTLYSLSASGMAEPAEEWVSEIDAAIAKAEGRS